MMYDTIWYTIHKNRKTTHNTFYELTMVVGTFFLFVLNYFFFGVQFELCLGFHVLLSFFACSKNFLFFKRSYLFLHTKIPQNGEVFHILVVLCPLNHNNWYTCLLIIFFFLFFNFLLLIFFCLIGKRKEMY